MSNEESLRAEFAEDPGSSGCVRLADLLRVSGRALEALEVCLEGLSTNPQNHMARLLLARIFAERGYAEFALREVKELLPFFPENQALKKLCERLSPGALVQALQQDSEGKNEGRSDGTLAEADLDFGDLEELAAEEKERKA